MILRTQRRASIAAAASAAVFALGLALFAGCGGDDDGPTAPGPGAPTDTFAPATTSGEVVTRLMNTYEAENSTSYGLTLTSNFHYVFSSQSDPDLVTEFGGSFDAAMEVAAAQHLFAGFTDGQSQYQEAAVTISSTLPFVQELSDPEHPDSTDHYRLVAVPRLLMEIVLEGDIQYSVDAPFNFYVVRGDAAVLGSTQTPGANRWYLRRIDDLTAPFPTAQRSTTLKPASPVTWGSVRARYVARQPVVLE